MTRTKVFYVVFGVVVGFMTASAFFTPELKAQWGTSSFKEEAMESSLPAKYGKLVAVSGIIMYFQAEDGSVYIVKPRTNTELDSSVTVIRRS